MKRLVYALALIAILLMNSCIKENFENCNVKVRLLFSYFGDGDSQIFLDKNNKVNLYVYDTSHEIVLTKEINYQKLLEFQGTYLDLPPGDYNIVCWSNLHGSTQVDAKSFTDSKIDHLVNTKDNKYVEPIDSLYYGTYKLNVPQTYKLAKDTLISDIIPFEAAHINFEIAVRENGTTSNASDKYTIVMEGLPSSSDFTKVTNPTTCAYLLSLDKADGALSYTQFNSMRFPNDNQIVVKLISKADNSVVYELTLKDFLAKEKIDVEAYQEVTVPILIELGNGLGVTIRVEKWIRVELKPEI